MKLWKSKKTSSTTSCVPSGKGSTITTCKSTQQQNEDNIETSAIATAAATTATSTTTSTTTTPVNGDRAMSPAQSEDSGLAADRSSTYATISIPRENAQAMGIIFAERQDLAYPPVIESINVVGPAADFLAPGDRIHQIDGISTIGLTNQHIYSVLCHGEGQAVIEIEYSLPEYISQSSLCVTSKLAQITVERENGCLGLTLRGGGEYPLIVTNVRPNGPVFKTGRIKPGDRVLRVDNTSLVSKSLSEAQQILKCGHVSGFTNLTIEYDVSVMQSVEFSLGPLLIEIERPMNEKLGLILSNYSNIAANDPSKIDEVQQCGVYIASILPASIADRCGALTIGDQILSVDETIVENSSYTPDEVTRLLDANTNRGYTQLQILPTHALLRRRGVSCGSPKYGFNTMDSRKTKQRAKFGRKSSLPPTVDTATLHPNYGLCRSETIQVVLDCTQGSGICLGPQTPCGRGYIIAQVLADSPSERSGCIQKGDRILSVNKLYNLDIATMRQILGDVQMANKNMGTNWVELEIEFDMADSVIPASGVFNVKLVKQNKSGLGITVNGSSHGAFVIAEVKPGSPAHRTGSLRAGDILLAVDSHPIQHFNVDMLLKENKNEFITLTVKRTSLPDFLFDAQQRSNVIYGSSEDNAFGYTSRYADPATLKPQTSQPNFFQLDDSRSPTATLSQIRKPNWSSPHYDVPRPINTISMTTEMTEDAYGEVMQYNIDYPQRLAMLNLQDHSLYGQNISSLDNTPEIDDCSPLVFNVRLESNGGPLGITLAGSEDKTKPIIISGLIEGGVAFNTGKIQIGDQLLAINGETICGVALSAATRLLQKIDNVVDLQISRPTNYNVKQFIENSPQTLAIYAKVHRRPKSPPVDELSTCSRDTPQQQHHPSFHVTLFKDRVYDDYGFSVSDGLYERGVYINRIRSGGPADAVGLLKPFDRIIQVNGTKTQDFDCCLTVPLIAAAGDKIDLVIQRPITE